MDNDLPLKEMNDLITSSLQTLSNPYVAENGLPHSKNHTFYDDDEDDKESLIGELCNQYFACNSKVGELWQ